MHEELIKSNEFLSMQVWVLGGLVSFLLMVLIYLAKTSFGRVEAAIADHENRIQTVEKNERDTAQVLKFTTDGLKENTRLTAELATRLNKWV